MNGHVCFRCGALEDYDYYYDEWWCPRCEHSPSELRTAKEPGVSR